MLGASLFIIRCTARNRLRVRLKRLREPRYLIGAIVGAAYIYFSFFARLRTQRSATRRRGAAPFDAGLATLAAVGPSIGGLALLAMTALGWLLPFDSGLLEFSPSEIQFLFPAPVSRRALLVHRMLRSQLGMLFGSVVVGLVTPSASGYARLRMSIGVWLLLSTSKIYFTGISLARARLATRNGHARRVAWLPLGVMLGAIAVVGAALVQALLARPIAGPQDALGRIAGATGSGAPRIVMWPFVALASPLFAAWPGPYFAALAGAAVVLIASVLWVVKSDETFQDATEEIAARKGAEQSKATIYKARSAGWPLAPLGRPELAFAWKAATQTLRIVDKRSVLRLLAILVPFTIAAASMGRRNGLAGALAAFSLAGSVFTVMLGPQLIRIDMRQDLQHLELLKTWPLRASAVIRGQLIWPGLLISGLAWTMIAPATYFVPALSPGLGLAMRLAVGIAALILAPALAFAQLTVHNGTALIFPAWIPLGRQRPRGLDAMGQRIIMLGGTWLALLALTLPGAIVGTAVWFAFRSLVGALALVPAAAVCATALAIEVLLLTEILGPAYERLDLMAVERAE